jgi:hypothetical protein
MTPSREAAECHSPVRNCRVRHEERASPEELALSERSESIGTAWN